MEIALTLSTMEIPRLRLPHIQQHPAAAAAEDEHAAKMKVHTERRLRQLAKQASLAEQRRAKECQLNTYFVRSRVSADHKVNGHEQRPRDAFGDLVSYDNRRCEGALHHGGDPDSARSAPAQLQKPMPPLSSPSPHRSPRQPKLSSRRKDVGQGVHLTSAQAVRVCYDLLRRMAALAEIADQRHGAPSRSLLDVAREYIEDARYGRDVGPGGPPVSEMQTFTAGLLGIRIGLAECDPHPLVRLFQRLAGWADPPISRPDAIFHIFGWLMPSRERMHKEVQSGKPDGSKASGPRLGAAPVYEPMPPRTCVSFEATGKVLRLLADRQHLEKELVPYLLRAAEALVERKGARRVVDVVRESKA